MLMILAPIIVMNSVPNCYMGLILNVNDTSSSHLDFNSAIAFQAFNDTTSLFLIVNDANSSNLHYSHHPHHFGFS